VIAASAVGHHPLVAILRGRLANPVLEVTEEILSPTPSHRRHDGFHFVSLTQQCGRVIDPKKVNA
jgi:hypothetical protein